MEGVDYTLTATAASFVANGDVLIRMQITNNTQRALDLPHPAAISSPQPTYTLTRPDGSSIKFIPSDAIAETRPVPLGRIPAGTTLNGRVSLQLLTSLKQPGTYRLSAVIEWGDIFLRSNEVEFIITTGVQRYMTLNRSWKDFDGHVEHKQWITYALEKDGRFETVRQMISRSGWSPLDKLFELLEAESYGFFSDPLLKILPTRDAGGTALINPVVSLADSLVMEVTKHSSATFSFANRPTMIAPLVSLKVGEHQQIMAMALFDNPSPTISLAKVKGDLYSASQTASFAPLITPVGPVTAMDAVMGFVKQGTPVVLIWHERINDDTRVNFARISTEGVVQQVISTDVPKVASTETFATYVGLDGQLVHAFVGKNIGGNNESILVEVRTTVELKKIEALPTMPFIPVERISRTRISFWERTQPDRPYVYINGGAGHPDWLFTADRGLKQLPIAIPSDSEIELLWKDEAWYLLANDGASFQHHELPHWPTPSE